MIFIKTYFFIYALILANALIYVITGITPGYAQTYYFDKITTRHGLSQNTINCIFQDHQGFLWLGTQDGLNRYDGNDFQIYRYHPDDTASITHNWIWDIIEDDQQNLWVATWDGLNKLPAHSNSVVRYYPDSIGEGYRGRRSTSFSIDKQGNLWIGTWGEGINQYVEGEDIFINYQGGEGDSSTFPSNLVRDILHDRMGRLWVGTWNGLSCIDSITDGNILKITTYQYNPDDPHSLSDNRITCLYEDKMGVIWIGTLEGGLNRLDRKRQKFLRYGHDPGNPGSISGNDISCILEDRGGNLWIGTFSNGLNKLNNKRGDFLSIKYRSKDPGSLAGNYVYSIFEDQAGLIWIGANALNKYNPLRERFHHVRHDPEIPHSLSHQDVGAIYESKNGDIWIGTEGGGLNKYIRKEDRCQKFLFQDQNGDISDKLAVGSVTEDMDGRLWAGTRRNGIYMLDEEEQVFRAYNVDSMGAPNENWRYVNFLITDRDGHLWIATFNSGLFQLDLETNSVKHYKNHPDDPSSLPGNYLLRLFLDDQDRLWIASWGGGLSAYNEKNDKFQRYLHDPEDSTSIADNIVYTVHCSMVNGKNMLWAGTGAGMSFADLDKWPDLDFTTLTIDDGLPNNTIYSIQHDHYGNLWISTNYGISKFDPELNTFHNYFMEDGLQANEFNGGAGIRTYDGAMIFGGINGFNIFHPDNIQISHVAPRIVITSIYVLNEVYLKDRAILASDEVKLSHRQNFFSFEFSALDFIQPQKIQYTYMLEGVDPTWVENQNRRLANYTAIEPGTYVFKVKSTNSDQVWTENETSIKISIIPPFWQTWWFRSLGILIFLALIYLIHRYRVRKILELERLRAQIASDLHDDFGSALTRIAIHSEQIQQARQREMIRNLSRKIGNISRDVISSMSDIVWSIDARNDTMKNLLDRIQEVNLNILSITDIDIKFTHLGMSKNKTIPVDCRQNIYYIYKEAINNIVKHASATAVDILLDNSNQQFIMRIKDNGIGIDLSLKTGGNGLRNMQMRARRIHGDLIIQSKDGTEILLKMKKL